MGNICLNCGISFKPKEPWHGKGKFCSRRCRDEYNSNYFKRQRSILTCEECGKKFSLPKYQARNRRFCSKKCQGVAFLGKNNPRWKPKVKKKCDNCGKEFLIIPSKAKRAKYCSEKCKRKAWLPRLLRNLERGRQTLKTPKFREKQAKRLKEYYRLHPEKHPNVIMMGRRGGYRYYVSKGQWALYTLVKKRVEAKLEFPIRTSESIYFADVAVPSLKIDFEYDGNGFWHSGKRASKDKRRDEELQEIGWRVIRVSQGDFQNISEIISNALEV